MHFCVFNSHTASFLISLFFTLDSLHPTWRWLPWPIMVKYYNCNTFSYNSSWTILCILVIPIVQPMAQPSFSFSTSSLTDGDCKVRYIFLCWLSTTGNGSEKNSRVLSRTLWAEGLTLVKALVIYRFPVQGNAEFLETPTLTLLERGMFAGCGKIEAKVEGIKWLFWPPGRWCA